MGTQCTLGAITLSASPTRAIGGLPCNGQLLAIATNTALFSLIGNTFGGDGTTNFALPNLAAAAPNGLTYTICHQGIYPSFL